MDKKSVFKALEEKLGARLSAAISGFDDAAEYATSEEAKADSKYDTQGLEASYLAAGQAASAQRIRDEIEKLRSFLDEFLETRTEVSTGALVGCQIEGEKELFVMSPFGGGETVELDGNIVDVVSPNTPLGQSLLGKKCGDVFCPPAGSIGFVETVE